MWQVLQLHCVVSSSIQTVIFLHFNLDRLFAYLYYSPIEDNGSYKHQLSLTKNSFVFEAVNLMHVKETFLH